MSLTSAPVSALLYVRLTARKTPLEVSLFIRVSILLNKPHELQIFRDERFGGSVSSTVNCKFSNKIKYEVRINLKILNIIIGNISHS